MKFLVLMSDAPGSKPSDFTPLGESERIKVYELKHQGKISEIYFRSDRDDAILMLECDDLKDAKTILNSLPMVEAGLLEYDLIELRDYPSRS